MRPIVNEPAEDQATDVGNMHNKLVKIASVVPEISCRTADRQTDRHTHTDILITIFCRRSSRRSNKKFVEREQSESLVRYGASVRTTNFWHSAEKRRETVQHPWDKLFQTVGPDTLKHRRPYVGSLTIGTTSWFLLTDLREYWDDGLCDAGWTHADKQSGAMP